MIRAPGAASLGSCYEPELKFEIHLDKWAKRGGTETSALQAERGKRPDQWQRRPLGSEPNRPQPGDKSGARSLRLNSPSSWWTFSWPASSEMCHRGVRVINRSGYTPERPPSPPTLWWARVRSTSRPKQRGRLSKLNCDYCVLGIFQKFDWTLLNKNSIKALATTRTLGQQRRQRPWEGMYKTNCSKLLSSATSPTLSTGKSLAYSSLSAGQEWCCCAILKTKSI